MPSVIRTNIRHVLQGPLIAMFPLHSSLDVISLSWLCYYHCLHISIPPFPCPPPKPACKPYSIIFPRLCPVTPSHHIHLHIVQHLTFSYLGSISHDVIFSNLRHSVDLCKLSTYMLFLRTSYTSTRCLFMFGEHNTMKSKLYWNGSLTDNLDIIKYVIRSIRWPQHDYRVIWPIYVT